MIFGPAHQAVVDAARNLIVDLALDAYPNEIDPAMSAKLAPLTRALAAVTAVERAA